MTFEIYCHYKDSLSLRQLNSHFSVGFFFFKDLINLTEKPKELPPQRISPKELDQLTLHLNYPWQLLLEIVT